MSEIFLQVDSRENLLRLNRRNLLSRARKRLKLYRITKDDRTINICAKKLEDHRNGRQGPFVGISSRG